MFTAVLFITAKRWKQPKYPLTDEWINKWNIIFLFILKYTEYIIPYNGILFGHEKEWSIDTCYSMDELWKHYVQWKKTVTKDHMLYDSINVKCPE